MRGLGLRSRGRGALGFVSRRVLFARVGAGLRLRAAGTWYEGRYEEEG